MTISDSWLIRPRPEGGSPSVEQQSFGFSEKGSFELLGLRAKSKKLMEPQNFIFNFKRRILCKK